MKNVFIKAVRQVVFVLEKQVAIITSHVKMFNCY